MGPCLPDQATDGDNARCQVGVGLHRCLGALGAPADLAKVVDPGVGRLDHLRLPTLMGVPRSEIDYASPRLHSSAQQGV